VLYLPNFFLQNSFSNDVSIMDEIYYFEKCVTIS
jgi:hypothetical protein